MIMIIEVVLYLPFKSFKSIQSCEEIHVYEFDIVSRGYIPFLRFKTVIVQEASMLTSPKRENQKSTAALLQVYRLLLRFQLYRA